MKRHACRCRLLRRTCWIFWSGHSSLQPGLSQQPVNSVLALTASTSFPSTQRRGWCRHGTPSLGQGSECRQHSPLRPVLARSDAFQGRENAQKQTEETDSGRPLCRSPQRRPAELHAKGAAASAIPGSCHLSCPSTATLSTSREMTQAPPLCPGSSQSLAQGHLWSKITPCRWRPG